jgi:2-polyprenyl-3-methyl-5-hydroxy-6-metoxy-1,4-benzoquinol methylase
MVFVNTFFGGTQAVLDYFNKNKTPVKFTVLDLGSGGGDIPFALTQWAAKRGKEIFVTAIDLNPHCHAYASARFASPRIHFLKHSAFELEALGPFDYIISSMFFHHLSDEEITRLLKLIHRQSRLGFLINDLYRCRRNYFGAILLSCLSFKKVIYNDAKLSVSRAFKKRDFIYYREQTGVPFEIERKPLFRIVMSRHDNCSD